MKSHYISPIILPFSLYSCTCIFLKNCPYIKPYIFAWGYFKPWIWHRLLTPIWHWPSPRDCTLQTVNLSCLRNTTSIPYFKKLLEVDILFYILHSEITTLCIGCPYSIGFASKCLTKRDTNLCHFLMEIKLKTTS